MTGPTFCGNDIVMMSDEEFDRSLLREAIVARSRGRITPAMRLKIVQEYMAGDSMEELARRHGVAYGTIRNCLRKAAGFKLCHLRKP